MRFLIVAAISVLLAAPLTAGVIPINATVFVPIKPDALGYVRASILQEDVPVQLGADPDKAEYTLVGGFEEDSDGSRWPRLARVDLVNRNGCLGG